MFIVVEPASADPSAKGDLVFRHHSGLHLFHQKKSPHLRQQMRAFDSTFKANIMKLSMKMPRTSIRYGFLSWLGNQIYRLRKRLEKLNDRIDRYAGRYFPD